MYCINCGSAIPEDKGVCPVCGNPVNAAQGNPQGAGTPPVYNTNTTQTPPPYYGYGAPQSKSRVAAGILQIFLGYFGVGRFYLGYTTIGVLQLIVSLVTCGIGGLWGFIDGILILSGEVKTDAFGVPLRD